MMREGYITFWWPVRCSNHWATWTKMMSEGYICVQPVTFWWPVRCSNHWATWTKMMSECYICVQPVTFWWPMRCSNHWATWTKMMSEGYICVQPVTFWWPVRYSNQLPTLTKMTSGYYIYVLWRSFPFSLRTWVTVKKISFIQWKGRHIGWRQRLSPKQDTEESPISGESFTFISLHQCNCHTKLDWLMS